MRSTTMPRAGAAALEPAQPTLPSALARAFELHVAQVLPMRITGRPCLNPTPHPRAHHWDPLPYIHTRESPTSNPASTRQQATPRIKRTCPRSRAAARAGARRQRGRRWWPARCRYLQAGVGEWPRQGSSLAVKSGPRQKGAGGLPAVGAYRRGGGQRGVQARRLADGATESGALNAAAPTSRSACVGRQQDRERERERCSEVSSPCSSRVTVACKHAGSSTSGTSVHAGEQRRWDRAGPLTDKAQVLELGGHQLCHRHAQPHRLAVVLPALCSQRQAPAGWVGLREGRLA